MKDTVSQKVIYVTTDYDSFKRLKGNRSVPESRVSAIKKSILRVGYITNPIIVNEHKEVIDGQGRLQAEKELSLPVEYIIHEGATIEECRAMNLKQSNWGIRDYVESYAEGDNKSYIYLLDLMNKYKKIGLTAIYNAITGLDSLDSSKLKLGLFEMSCGERDYANELLNYEARFISIVEKMQGRKDYLYMSFGYAYRNSTVDNERMFEIASEEYRRVAPPANKLEALEEISAMYNKRVRPDKRIYLKTDYEREMNNKYPWYEDKWLKPRKDLERARHYE